MQRNKLTYGDYFTGGGLATAGAKNAGFDILFGVENDPANLNQSMRICDHYEDVFGPHMIRKPVQDVDPAELPYVDWFHASPVCKNYSVAKTSSSGDEGVDMITSEATAAYIDHHRPEWVTIENVRAYDGSDALGVILKTLIQNGYQWQLKIINMADYGVPQTRIRMIVLARLNASPGFPEPTHTKDPLGGFFEPLKRWVGWYASIEDLIPSLEESYFPKWQLERLPEFIRSEVSCLAPGGNASSWRPLSEREPAHTVTTSEYKSTSKALIVSSQLNSHGTTVSTRSGRSPMFTVTNSNSERDIKAWILGSANQAGVSPRDHETPAHTVVGGGGGRVTRAVLCHPTNIRAMPTRTGDQPAFTQTVFGTSNYPRAYVGRVVKMSIEALGRFQSVPDWYTYPERRSDAMTIIGNGVPSLFMQRVGEHIWGLS